MKSKKDSIKFTSAVCPQCKGALLLSKDKRTAMCNQCGMECFIENQTTIDKILNFIQTSKDEHRAYKEEKRQRKLQEKKLEEEKQKRAMIYGCIMLAIVFTIVIIMMILESYGIIS